MLKISGDTALVCEVVIGRFIAVLAETPQSGLNTPEFKAALVAAEAEIKAARQAVFLNIQQEVMALPVTSDATGLV